MREFFASAHATWVASDSPRGRETGRKTLPQHTLHGLRRSWEYGRVACVELCLSTRYVGCVLSDQVDGVNINLTFASAHAMWVASCQVLALLDVVFALPQHTLCGLRRQKYFALFCRMCCKLVDSFSVEQRMLTALTIFPDFSAAKATYVAIIDSLGRTIDRFLWCEHPVFFLLTSTSPDAHTGRCLWHLA